MKRLICNNGDKFGFWTVVDNTPLIKSGHSYVRVRCKCGKEEMKCLSDLFNKRANGCRNCMARLRGNNLNIGDKFKSWTIINGPEIKNNSQLWECKCKCGKTRWFQAAELLNPNKSFECRICATKSRIKTLVENKGAINDLYIGKYNKLKKSAEYRNIEFNVSMEYLWNLFIKQKQICMITGDYIDNIKNASLDRIDSSKGYIEDNVQWVTKQANISKHVMTMEQLYEFCKKVLIHANQQPSQPLTKLEGSETNS